jgi:hypothetical protein
VEVVVDQIHYQDLPVFLQDLVFLVVMVGAELPTALLHHLPTIHILEEQVLNQH